MPPENREYSIVSILANEPNKMNPQSVEKIFFANIQNLETTFNRISRVMKNSSSTRNMTMLKSNKAIKLNIQ